MPEQQLNGADVGSGSACGGTGFVRPAYRRAWWQALLHGAASEGWSGRSPGKSQTVGQNLSAVDRI